MWQAWAPAATAGLLLALALATVPWTGDTMGVLGTPGWLVAIQLGALTTLGALVARRRAALAGAVALLLVTTEGLVFATPFIRVRGDTARNPVVEQLATHDMVRVTSICEGRLSGAHFDLGWHPDPRWDSAESRLSTTHAFSVWSGTTKSRGTRPDWVTTWNACRRGLTCWTILRSRTVVTCEPIDHERFTLVEPLGSMYLYKNLTARPRALLTCAGEPREADRVMQMLWRGAYDRDGRLIVPPRIGVRWAPGTADDDRETIERSFGLVASHSEEDRTWEYDLLDVSPANVMALLSHPLVEDTSGIDRGSGRLVPRDPEPAPEPAHMRAPSLVLDTGAVRRGPGRRHGARGRPRRWENAADGAKMPSRRSCT